MAATPRTLSLGFIGGAVNSAVGYAHFAACGMDRRWKLAAGCFSRRPEINRQTAETYGVASERLYASWQELLEAEAGKLDAVTVLTPTPLHFDIVRACMERNIPVICEKSLVNNSKDAESLASLQERRKSFVAMIYNYSGYPVVRELRHMIAQGKLGRIKHFQVEMPQEGFIRVDQSGHTPKPQEWRLHDGAIPVIHLDLGSHLHHLIYYLTGAHPERVIADQGSHGGLPGVVDNVNCLCRYSGGIQGQIWFSKSALGYRNGLRIRIYGEKAAAEWFQMDPEQLHISYNNGLRETFDRAGCGATVSNLTRYTRFKAGHPAGFVEALANLYCDIAGGLEEYQEKGYYTSKEFFSIGLAAEGLHFLDSMVKSFQEAAWVSVPQASPGPGENNG